MFYYNLYYIICVGRKFSFGCWSSNMKCLISKKYRRKKKMKTMIKCRRGHLNIMRESLHANILLHPQLFL